MLELIVRKETLDYMPQDYPGRVNDLFDVLLIPAVEAREGRGYRRCRRRRTFILRQCVDLGCPLL